MLQLLFLVLVMVLVVDSSVMSPLTTSNSDTSALSARTRSINTSASTSTSTIESGVDIDAIMDVTVCWWSSSYQSICNTCYIQIRSICKWLDWSEVNCNVMWLLCILEVEFTSLTLCIVCDWLWLRLIIQNLLMQSLWVVFCHNSGWIRNMNGMSLQYTVCVCIMLCLYRILTVSCSVVVIVDYASSFSW